MCDVDLMKGEKIMSEYVMPNGQSFDNPVPPVNESGEYEIKRKIKKSYNWAGGVMLIQLAIAFAVQFAVSFVYSSVKMAEFMMGNPQASPEEIMEFTMSIQTPFYLLVVNTLCYLIANLACFFIGKGISKTLFPVKLFSKNKLGVPDSLLCVAAILGLQGLSMIVQFIMMSITKVSGVNEATAQMMSFSDNIAHNVLMIVYFVIIAAVTEELLCRGVMMKMLSPVSKTFALVASSVLFGVMHGNFNQMFNGALLGLVLGYAAMKSGSLKLPIICHMAANTNAMILAVLEYKLGEGAGIIEVIYAAILIVVGIVSIIMLYKRNGLINEEEDGFPAADGDKLEVEPEQKKQLTWKLLLKSPTFWIFLVIYIFTAIIMLTPITV